MPADLYSFEHLWRAYRTCRGNKRNTLNALRFELNAEANLLALQRDLRAHTYQPGRSICFVTDGPKPREAFAADFRDRVVHHLLVPHLERVFEPRFIHDSYACRVGKGTLAASDRLMRFLRQITANGRRPAWALHLDVASFFPSIHKQTLFDIVCRRVGDPELRWLTDTILFHDPTTNYHFHGRAGRVPPPGSSGYPVPRAKSLFGNDNERGLPIGNLTSQFWANVYLNEVDQFVKRELKGRHYTRYVDDMILLAERPELLIDWRAAITGFLRQRLRLELRAEISEPLRVSRGVDFVGWKTWWSHRVPRRRTLGNVRERLRCFERAAVYPVLRGTAQRIDLRQPAGAGNAEQLCAALASYAGHLRHGAAWREWEEIWKRWPWLEAVLLRTGWAIRLRWNARGAARATTFRLQYARLIRDADARTVVFCRVGRVVEFYGVQRPLAEQVLNLRAARLHRGGYMFGAGFPRPQWRRYVIRALASGYQVAEVSECRPSVPRSVMQRVVSHLLRCVAAEGVRSKRP